LFQTIHPFSYDCSSVVKMPGYFDWSEKKEKMRLTFETMNAARCMMFYVEKWCKICSCRRMNFSYEYEMMYDVYVERWLFFVIFKGLWGIQQSRRTLYFFFKSRIFQKDLQNGAPK
jgi:hypothetical protein